MRWETVRCLVRAHVVARVRKNATLVIFSKVVDKVKEGRAVEGCAKVAAANVSRHEAGKPVIGDNERWDDAFVAEQFQGRLGKQRNGLQPLQCRASRVGSGEKFGIVDEKQLDPGDKAGVDTDVHMLGAQRHRHVELVVDAVTLEVVRLALAVALVVWRNDVDVDAKVSQALRKLVHHDTQPPNSRPFAELRAHEDHRAEVVCLQGGFGQLTTGRKRLREVNLSKFVGEVAVEHTGRGRRRGCDRRVTEQG
mmetsp:Transcript_1889/g.4282  ORF Transcript_1889/g.4282 Transcript_1889/m.4282 type:complete len:251 (-) Transcript_1889:3341-4093(-)